MFLVPDAVADQTIAVGHDHRVEELVMNRLATGHRPRPTALALGLNSGKAIGRLRAAAAASRAGMP